MLKSGIHKYLKENGEEMKDPAKEINDEDIQQLSTILKVKMNIWRRNTLNVKYTKISFIPRGKQRILPSFSFIEMGNNIYIIYKKNRKELFKQGLECNPRIQVIVNEIRRIRMINDERMYNLGDLYIEDGPQPELFEATLEDIYFPPAENSGSDTAGEEEKSVGVSESANAHLEENKHQLTPQVPEETKIHHATSISLPNPRIYIYIYIYYDKL